MNGVLDGRESEQVATASTSIPIVRALGNTRGLSADAFLENLTIQQAQSFYAHAGNYRIFRDLLQRTVSSPTRIEFDNDSYLDALFLTELMFDRTRREMRILSGPAGDGFLSTLAAPFEVALQRVSEAKGFIRIILLSKEVPPFLEEIRKRFADVLFISLAQAANPVKHFIVCDSQIARLEEEHGELKPDTLASEIKAKVYLNAPEKAVWLEKFFDSVWAKLRELEAKK